MREKTRYPIFLFLVTQVRKELDQPIDKKTLSNLEETAPIDIIEQGEGVLDIEEGIPQKASDYVPYQCDNCKKTGHFSRNCPDMKCSECQETGHMSYECKNKKCYRCQEIGHMARDCKKPKVDCDTQLPSYVPVK